MASGRECRISPIIHVRFVPSAFNPRTYFSRLHAMLSVSDPLVVQLPLVNVPEEVAPKSVWMLDVSAVVWSAFSAIGVVAVPFVNVSGSVKILRAVILVVLPLALVSPGE